MKKLLILACILFPFIGLMAQAQNSSNEVLIGQVEMVYTDGSVDVMSQKTGKLVKITGTSLEASNLVKINGTALEASNKVRINGTSLEASNFTLTIGTTIGFIEVQTGTGTKPVIVFIN